ncbi:hypothetical protein Ahy_B09g097610 [Arachis hypogaea]|uniref:FAR1 domain-containing protein n=1 Tax=Arachis hypogaea TaxID=3818 RepID=A0A444XPH1_ARAHY|nr:hypothetical protein Ahy_B09g097610 [Arachis hypogaea]
MFKDEEGNLVQKNFFCNRGGQRDKKYYNMVDRKRPHKPETRTNCEARMVKKVILNHNHEMTHPVTVHQISSFRSMMDTAKAQIDGFQGCGISTVKTMRYMAGVSGAFKSSRRSGPRPQPIMTCRTYCGGTKCMGRRRCGQTLFCVRSFVLGIG